MSSAAPPHLTRRSVALLLTGVIGIFAVGYFDGTNNKSTQHFLSAPPAPPAPSRDVPADDSCRQFVDGHACRQLFRDATVRLFRWR